MHSAVIALLGALAVAGAARAEAPEPRRGLDLDRFMGRWYEILRTPNGNQRNCYAAYQEWSVQDRSDGPDRRFHIRQHCHRGSPTGSEHMVNTSARVLNPPSNTKFEASFFGGLIRGRYWVVDHADDYSWMIATTEDGRYPALLARTPGLPPREQERLKVRMAEIGFDTGKLQAVGARP